CLCLSSLLRQYVLFCIRGFFCFSSKCLFACCCFFFSSRRRHTRSVSAFLLNRSSDLSLLVRLVVLLPFQLLRLSLATPSRWTPLALSVFLHCVVALLLTLL